MFQKEVVYAALAGNVAIAITKFGAAFYSRRARIFNKILLRDDGRAGRIIEVEAYCGSEDPAAHPFRGPTPRNRTMFGPAGHMDVYFTYGMHWCANTVCGAEGLGWGISIRAVTPIAGIAAMRAARPRARTDRDLASGPARLTHSFGIDGSLDGADLIDSNRGECVVTDCTPPPSIPRVGPRIGISRAKEFPWRWRAPRRDPLSITCRHGRRDRPTALVYSSHGEGRSTSV